MDLNRLWQNIQEEFKIAVSKATYQGILAQTRLVSLKNNIATVGCPNTYFCELIEKRYYSLIKEVIDRQTKKNNSLVFVVDFKVKKEKKEKLGPLFKAKKNFSFDKKNNGFNPETGLLPYYSFDTFVVGPTNNFAHAAALGIVKTPGNAYNPFFIWGGVGMGKTHLIQAIGNAITEQHPQLKVLYVAAETFTNELVHALQNKSITKFKEKYRTRDVLLVDDIQFIAGKEYSQEEFFHTFNSLYLSGHQIILTSDRKPEEIQPLEDRLISRFMGGLTVDIQPPDFEMRLAILKQKSKERNISVPEETLSFLAETIKSNARELEGALFQLINKAQSNNQEITPETARTLFGFKKKQTRRISSRSVLAKTARYFSFKTKDLCGKSRKAEIVIARHVAMYVLRKDLNLPLIKIGELLGGKDHTTVIYAIKKIEQQFSVNQNLRHQIATIRKNLR